MFVVFEGIDGSGKTTVSNRVAKRLRAAGVAVEHVREDGEFASALVRRQREFGRDPRNLALEPWAELLFYLSRAAQIDAELTRPALARGGLVFADRHVDSYQVLGHDARGLPRERVQAVIEAMSGRLRPDLIVLLDVDPHVARARRRVGKIQSRSSGREASSGSRKGLGGVGAQRRMRDGYLALAAAEPDRWLVFDNGSPEVDLDAVVEGVADAILARVRQQVVVPPPPALTLVPLPNLFDDADDEVGPDDEDDDEAGDGVAQPIVAEGSGAIAAVTSRAGAPAPSPAERQAAQPALSAAPPAPPIPLDRAPALFYAQIEARARREPAVAAYFLTGLADPAAHDWRERLIERAPDLVAFTLRGLADPPAWRLRDRLIERAPVSVARSLAGRGVVGPRADAMRLALADAHPEAVLSTITGRDDEPAWQLRDRLVDRAPSAVVGTLADLDGPRAWAMRARFLAGGDAMLADPVAAGALARSLRGLAGDEAWRLRRLGFPAAPIQAIESLAGVLDDESWDWRRRWLERAPRAVLVTIAMLDDRRAWELRGRIAARVKEVFDSMIGLDGDEAWALRDAWADTWPSTCVKSLGPLQASARGADLAARLLAANPGDISLLKHLTANAHAGSVELAWEEAG
ncbi:MAG TPA: dTMP kinase [Kofleriaceae bacterium]|nr:dTMP kinase [Kofleriaceae bacterium]